MSEIDKCPLPLDGAFMYEEDIPFECRECLDITLDSDRGSFYANSIGVPHKLDPSQNIDDGNSACDHDSYYWITSLKRGDITKRVIDIAAACDLCENFVSRTYIADCKIN